MKLIVTLNSKDAKSSVIAAAIRNALAAAGQKATVRPMRKKEEAALKFS